MQKLQIIQIARKLSNAYKKTLRKAIEIDWMLRLSKETLTNKESLIQALES